jgi:RND superfamily putative drug exporter
MLFSGVMEPLLDRLGRFSARHPWRTISAWLLVAVALLALGQATGGTFVNDFRIPGAESQRAADLAREHFPAYGAASADIVWHAGTGTLRDPQRAAAIAGMLAGIRTQPDVTEVGDPLAAGGLLSPDGRTATATVRYGREFGELTPAAYERLDRAADAVRSTGVTVDFRGPAVEIASEPETGSAELFGLGAALLVLLLAFGSVVAAGLPVAVALVGLVVGTALVLLAGALVDIPTSAPIVAVMLGLGAGIDYALFVLTRFRAHLADGLSPVAAAGRAVATAGHAVLFAGATVVVAILGLLFTGIPFVGAMGIAAALTVTVMMVAALTLLPALLGLLGRHVDRGRIGRRRATAPAPAAATAPAPAAGTAAPAAGHAAPVTAPGVTGRWDRWGEHLDRHRVGYALGATALLLAIAAPALTLRLGTPDDGNAPRDWTQRRAYDTVAAAFGPGWNGPLVVAVTLPGGAGAEAGVARLTGALATDREVGLTLPPVRSADGRVALVTVVPRHAPQDERVADLVHRIRRTLAPQALGPDGGRAFVGGTSAFMIDMADAVAARLPWVVLAVVVAASLLLVAMFRAPLIALKAALMTLLSIGAAYGVLVAVFQWGWGLSLIGVDQPVPIMSVVPMLLFAVLFGLSMDYEVFLLSAVREEYATRRARSRPVGDPAAEAADHDARRAVVAGLAGTGRVITAAATIMAVVFLSFVGINDTMVKMIGIGLATAVVVDATVIRVVLAPAVLGLLGRWAWWPVARRGSGHAAPAATDAPVTRERVPAHG